MLHAREVEGRDHRRACAVSCLNVAVGQTEREQIVPHLVTFALCDAAREGGEAVDVAHRGVLEHQAYVDVGDGGEGVEAGERVPRVPREHQMPHDGAAYGEAVFIEGERSCLANHFPNRRFRHGRVIGCAREGGGERRVGVFEIGEVDVHEALQRAERFHPLVAAAVVYHGDGRAIERERLTDGDEVRRGADEVDVMRACGDELAEDVRQAFGGDGAAGRGAADGVILAKGAGQRAAAEKDGARAALAADAGFFAVMQGGARHGGDRRQGATTLAVRFITHSGTPMRTQRAGEHGETSLGILFYYSADGGRAQGGVPPTAQKPPSRKTRGCCVTIWIT